MTLNTPNGGRAGARGVIISMKKDDFHKTVFFIPSGPMGFRTGFFSAFFTGGHLVHDDFPYLFRDFYPAGKPEHSAG
jgi:hypothetical protein